MPLSIAPPQRLGVLHANYGEETERHLLAEIGKDLTEHVTDDIIQLLTTDA